MNDALRITSIQPYGKYVYVTAISPSGSVIDKCFNVHEATKSRIDGWLVEVNAEHCDVVAVCKQLNRQYGLSEWSTAPADARESAGAWEGER